MVIPHTKLSKYTTFNQRCFVLREKRHTLPKYPGWYLSKFILWWCMPPALPRPPACLRCLPESNYAVIITQSRSYCIKDNVACSTNQFKSTNIHQVSQTARSFTIITIQNANTLRLFRINAYLPIRPCPWLTCPRSFLVFFL